MKVFPKEIKTLRWVDICILREGFIDVVSKASYNFGNIELILLLV